MKQIYFAVNIADLTITEFNLHTFKIEKLRRSMLKSAEDESEKSLIGEIFSKIDEIRFNEDE